jgi:hypothetical protein
MSQKLTMEDIPQLCKQWIEEFKDLCGEIPLRLPPLRLVNHEICLIDPDKQYHYRLPECADHYKEQLLKKIKQYTTTGWWVPTSVWQATPMLCMLKKTPGVLRTVFDLRQQNENTIKDVTPFLDQDTIRHDMARAKYRLKLGLTEAYEQICIEPKDVPKMAFSTIVGTFVSNVLQMGDMNGPSTCQHLMVHIFRELIRRCAHVYMDNIFIFSTSIEKHEEHLRQVFTKLREAHLYLSRKKVELYTDSVECLGHLVDG